MGKIMDSTNCLRLGGSLLGLVRLLFGLLLGLGGLGGGLGLDGVGRGPESQVIAQELHDKRAVAVRLLREGVELGDSIVEGLLGKVASAIGRVENLVVKDREVERQAQANGVGGGKLGLGDIGGALYGVREWSANGMARMWGRRIYRWEEAIPCKPRGQR